MSEEKSTHEELLAQVEALKRERDEAKTALEIESHASMLNFEEWQKAESQLSEAEAKLAEAHGDNSFGTWRARAETRALEANLREESRLIDKLSALIVEQRQLTDELKKAAGI